MEREPEDFQDIEWMLKSGQASVPILAEALLSRYGPQLMRLAFAILLDLPTAQQAVEEGVARAIQRGVREWSGLDLENWLTANVVQSAARHSRRQTDFPLSLIHHLQENPDPPASASEIQLWAAFGRLKPGDRMALILIKGLDVPARQAAQWLKEPEKAVQGRAEHSLELLFQRSEVEGVDFIEVFGSSSWTRDRAGIFRALLARRTLQAGLPSPGTPAKLQASASRIAAKIEHQNQSGQKIRSRRDLVFGAAALLLVLFGLGLTNQLLPGSIPRPTPAPKLVQITATPRAERRPPVASPSSPLPYRPPLTSRSTAEEILQRMVESRTLWRSLWADAQIVYYGPPGYIGPPQVYRNQVWIRQPGEALFLTGMADGSPDAVFTSFGKNQFGKDFRLGSGVSNEIEPANQSFPLIHLANMDLNANHLLKGVFLNDLIFPDQAGFGDGVLFPVGEETIAGRNTILAEWYPQDNRGFISLSIDAQTGLILRWRQFHPRQSDLISLDIIITGLNLGARIPRGVFDLQQYREGTPQWGSIWVPDAQARQRFRYIPVTGVLREPLTRIGPPVDFDPAAYHLTFDWLPDPKQPDTAGGLVDLYSALYYLGRIRVGNPWELACSRSQDGSMIALMSPKDHTLDGAGTPFHWLRLSTPIQVHTAYAHEMINGDVAFSPDGKLLAYSGCTTNGNCGVILLDTATGEGRRLIAMAEAGYYAWSQDGKTLAFIGRSTASNPQMTLFLVNVASGEVQYDAPFRPDHPDLNRDAKLSSWGTAYPPTVGGIEACAQTKGG